MYGVTTPVGVRNIVLKALLSEYGDEDHVISATPGGEILVQRPGSGTSLVTVARVVVTDGKGEL